jgi:hypothetical protein
LQISDHNPHEQYRVKGQSHTTRTIEAKGAERPGDVRLAPTGAERRPKREHSADAGGMRAQCARFCRKQMQIDGGALRTRATCECVCFVPLRAPRISESRRPCGFLHRALPTNIHVADNSRLIYTPPVYKKGTPVPKLYRLHFSCCRKTILLPSRLYCRSRNLTGSARCSVQNCSFRNVAQGLRTLPPIGNFTLP